MKGVITPTWPNSKRGFVRRAQWGLLYGSAELFAGAVSILTLGQFASWLPLHTAFWLTVKESREMEKMEKKS